MSLFGIWSEFGFRENPYSQDTLSADETGDQLLVGRDEAVDALQSAIGSGGSHPSIEGPVGVGKSSLLSVTAYRMARTCMQARSRELFLPATRLLQARHDRDEFEKDAYLTLAQTLVRNAGSWDHVGLDEPDTDALRRWLNDPEFTSGGLEVSVMGSGAGVNRGREPNTSDGFSRSGFPELVRQELERCFPPGTGGIVCVLDNLELLESAGQARAALDELRDRLFNLAQLRWVLCGSRGIVSRARTERLSGVFQAPLTIGPLDHAAAVEAIERRIEHFGEPDAIAPVTPAGFEYLYRALNFNLRDAMSTAQEFAQWLYREYLASGAGIPSEGDRGGLLESWLAARAESAYRDANNVQPRNWQFFQDLADFGGRVASSEHEHFGFAKQQQMTSAVTQLANANLVQREVDPENGSRTINSVTALGWLVHFHRADYEMPTARATPGTP